MARNRRRQRSLGEMISSVSFYGIGIFFVLEAAQMRADGEPTTNYAAMFLCGAVCIFGGARFVIADLMHNVRRQRK